MYTILIEEHHKTILFNFYYDGKLVYCDNYKFSYSNAAEKWTHDWIVNGILPHDASEPERYTKVK